MQQSCLSYIFHLSSQTKNKICCHRNVLQMTLFHMSACYRIHQKQITNPCILVNYEILVVRYFAHTSCVCFSNKKLFQLHHHHITTVCLKDIWSSLQQTASSNSHIYESQEFKSVTAGRSQFLTYKFLTKTIKLHSQNYQMCML
jgi:hypothetical protein